MRWINGLWVALGSVGALVFAALFALSFAQPHRIEVMLKAVIGQQVSRQVGAAVDAFDERFVATQADKLRGRLGEQAQAIRERLKRGIPARVHSELERLQDPACECRQVLRAQLDRIALQMDKLPQFIGQRYADTVRQLLGELRLFSGINAASFALLALAGWMGLRGRLAPPVARSVCVAAGMLLLALGAALWGYLFKQNWLETLLFNRWVGWAYAVWLGVAFAWLCDLVLNRARLTLQALSSVGSASATGC